MARAEQGGWRDWHHAGQNAELPRDDGNAAWWQRGPRAWHQAGGDAELRKDDGNAASWQRGSRGWHQAGGNAELRKDDGIADTIRGLREQGYCSPDRTRRLCLEKYGRRFWEDEGDGPEEARSRSRSRSPREPPLRQPTSMAPPQTIKVKHERWASASLSFVTSHRRDVVDMSLISMCNAVPNFRVDHGHILFEDDEISSNRLRLNNLPSKLNYTYSIRDIEWYYWRWVTEIVFTRW